MKRLSPDEELAAARNLEPGDCDIAAVGGARRCGSCGRPGGGHEVDCQRVQRLEREKLQAECDHQSGTVTRTTGDPPGLRVAVGVVSSCPSRSRLRARC